MHQARNAAVAFMATRHLPDDLRVNDEAFRSGFAGTRCPARIEIVCESPLTIVDAAHNVASIQALVSVLREMTGGQRRALLIATTRGKDVSGMLRVLLPSFDRVVCTKYLNNPRAYPVNRLRELAQRIAREVDAPCGNSVLTAEDPRRALELIRADCEPDELICVTGSFFIAAEIREVIANR
jgi:dihydrofolate synthase/folylpolyglutamate synthase